jgi:hypothetical protein
MLGTGMLSVEVLEIAEAKWNLLEIPYALL